MLFSFQDSRISVPSCGTPNWRGWLKEPGRTLEAVAPCVFLVLLSDSAHSRVVLLQLMVASRLTTRQGMLACRHWFCAGGEVICRLLAGILFS